MKNIYVVFENKKLETIFEDLNIILEWFGHKDYEKRFGYV